MAKRKKVTPKDITEHRKAVRAEGQTSFYSTAERFPRKSKRKPKK